MESTGLLKPENLHLYFTLSFRGEAAFWPPRNLHFGSHLASRRSDNCAQHCDAARL